MQDTPSTTPDDYLPRPIGIPQQLLDQWIAIPNQEYLEIAVTRRDLDQLFALLDGIIKNQRILSQLIVDWSQGHLEEANKALRDSRFTSAQASNDLATWFIALMSSALAQRTARDVPSQ